MKPKQIKNYVDGLFNPKYTCFDCEFCQCGEVKNAKKEVLLDMGLCSKTGEKVETKNKSCSKFKKHWPKKKKEYGAFGSVCPMCQSKDIVINEAQCKCNNCGTKYEIKIDTSPKYTSTSSKYIRVADLSPRDKKVMTDYWKEMFKK